MCKYLILSLCVTYILYQVQGQDCIDYGYPCGSNEQCCGNGCCFQGNCISISGQYGSCNDLGDPCVGHTCPGGMDCQVFIPEECRDCEPQAICVQSTQVEC